MDILILNRFSVCHWSDFAFEDGTKKDKYFVSLNCKINDKEVAIVLPTSQYKKHYENSQVYIQDTVIVEESESKYFSQKTVIDLKNIRVISFEKIDQKYSKNKINYLGILEESISTKIENTIEESYLLPQKEIDRLLCKEELNV